MPANLDVIIHARDEATKVIRDLNQELGNVGQKGQAAGQQLGHVDKALGSVKTAALGFGAAMATAFVTDKLVTFAKESVAAASDLNESMSKTQVVFKDSADEVVAWSETTSKSIFISQQRALEAASTFGNLFTSMGVTGGAAADMSQEFVTLAADLASFNNIEVSEAITALQSGIVGEIEPMRRLGVTMNAAAVEAKAMEMGLADATDQISESDKVLARYELILEGTVNAQGDSARTAGELANQQRQLQAQTEELQAAIGKALIPAMTGVVTLANTHLIPAMTTLATEFSDTAVDAQTLAGALGVDLGGALDSAGIAGIGFGDIWTANIRLPLEAAQHYIGTTTDGFNDLKDVIYGEAIPAVNEYQTQVAAMSDEVREMIGATEDNIDVTQRQIEYQRQSAEMTDEARESIDQMERAQRAGTTEGHRYNQMLEEQAGAYDAVVVKAGLLASGQEALASVNDIMNQRLDDSAGAISHWEGLISDTDTALGYLDEQLKAGNITQEEHAEKTEKLTWLNERRKNGIVDDLIPAYIAEQLAAADLQTALDGLDQSVKDGTLSQEEATAQAAQLREEFEKQQNPVGTLIEKIGELIQTLIDLEDEDPNIEITANADAIKNAIEEMRAYAANNPINVPIHGVVAGGNDVPTYVPGGSAGGNDVENQGGRSNKSAFAAQGEIAGRAFGIGFSEGMISNTKPLLPEDILPSEEDIIDVFGNIMTGALTSIAQDFTGTGIVDIMTGTEQARLEEDARALEAYMAALVEAGFSEDSEAYKQVREDYQAIMAMIEAISAIAGTDAADAFWEEWQRENAERQYPEQAAREAAEAIGNSPDWGNGAESAADRFSDVFKWRVRQGLKDLPGDIIFEPDMMTGWEQAGHEHGSLYADAFNDAVSLSPQDLFDMMNGSGETDTAGPASLDSGVGVGGGGGPVGFIAGSVIVPAGAHSNSFLYEQSLLQNPGASGGGGGMSGGTTQITINLTSPQDGRVLEQKIIEVMNNESQRTI